MEQNEVTSFDLLKQKIRQVFPRLANHEFSISWKDFEDDNIIISSNEELLTALTESTGQVRRLYLTPSNPITVSIQPSFELRPMADLVAEVAVPIDYSNVAANDSSDDEDKSSPPPGCKRSWHSALRAPKPKFHPNVFCDGCEKHIVGHRYKCLECADFDLCFDCESKMLHEEHIMLRIPLTHSHFTKLHYFSKAMNNMSDTLHKIDNRCKKTERRMHKLYEGNMKRCDFLSMAAENIADDMIHNSKRCKRDLRDRKDKKEKKGNTSLLGGSAPAASSSATSSTPGGQQQSNEATSQGGCPFPVGILSSFLKSPTINNLLNPQNLSTLQQLFEHMSPVPEELLQEVAQNLADVRLNDPTAPNSTPAPTPSASSPSTPPMNPFSFNAKKANPASEPDGAMPSTSAMAQATASSQGEVLIDLVSQDGASGVSASHSEVVAESVPSQSGRSSRSSSEEADTEGWMVVDSQVKEGNVDHAQVYPKLPTVEPTPAPVVSQPVVPQRQVHFSPNPEVQKCLSALSEMGYDVSERAMIELAEEFKGNLSRVLNVLLS